MQTTTQTIAAGVQDPANQLRTRPLSPALGAEILNVDLSQPMTDAQFESIRDCWHDNIVVLLRNQRLSEIDQVRFAERFGTLALSHTRRYTTANPAVMLISNIRENGKQIGALPDGEMQFHSDQCYQ
ncbi:MAG TPA: TauD/TfdA family dioxygenase, partial [Xanthobacteraceae bacterium]|nr:TauD/TfdA family dioxygenase [Xanthobacteraceae bacterium]